MEEVLERLARSKFRSSFHLNRKLKKYVEEKGIETVKQHGYDFLNERLRPANPDNDGKQTPTKGHPIFVAQHACACCCRSCLEKWYNIPKGRELSEREVNYLLSILIKWIEKQCN